MGAILKFILMTLIVTYVVNQIFKLLSGKDTLKKNAQHIRNEYREGFRKEGDIYVSDVPESAKKARIKGGDYVDYEEMK
jgi:hypothetical protein